MNASQRLWYLVFISFRTWLNLSPSSSLMETGPYVKIGSASWRSCCSPGFWMQSACCWQVLHSFWPYCCQESSSLPEQMPSTLPVPLRSLSFRTLDLWWAAGSENPQRYRPSTSPWSILENPGTSKWSSQHPCPEPWWTAWLSQAWYAAVGRVFCLCPPEGRWWRSFLCKAPIPPAKASSSSCNAEHVSYYPRWKKTWVLGEARLLSQQKVHHLQVNTNKPLMLIIINFLQIILHRFIVLLQCIRVSDRYRGKLVLVV